MKYLRYLYARYVTSGWRRFKLRFVDFEKTPPVLVYQMGKVGSSSVYESLKRANLANTIYHVHFLSYNYLDQIEKYHRHVGAGMSLGALRFWRALRRKIDRSRAHIYLISLVREPVAREISDVFQNMARHHADLIADDGEVDINKTIGFLERKFSSFDESVDYTCTWFDREMWDAFGIDVYAMPFDHARGYSIFKNDKASLLLLRMENLSLAFEAAIQEFMGQKVPLRHANLGSGKRYARAYRQLLENFSLSRAAGDRIYASRYARHFYPDDIRYELMKKWLSAESTELIP